MSKIAAKKTRADIAKKLKEFGRILKTEKIILDDKKFRDASKNCLSSVPDIKGIKYDKKNSYGYEISDLPIHFKREDLNIGIFPKDSTISSILVSSKIVGKIVRPDYAEDPFFHLEFNLVVKGHNKDKKPLIACWHLDRHPDNSPSNTVHPVYHFQYGGRNLKIKDDNWGGHLVLDIPRIMHPPLDLILGIDFVLSNFLGNRRQNLCTERPYINSVIELQRKIWRPYVYALANNWQSYGEDNSRYTWDCDKIYPQILKAV